MKSRGDGVLTRRPWAIYSYNVRLNAYTKTQLFAFLGELK